MRSSAIDRKDLTFSRAHASRRFMDETERQIEQNTHTQSNTHTHIHNVYTLAHTHARGVNVESRRQPKLMTRDNSRPTMRKFKTRLPVHTHIDG